MLQYAQYLINRFYPFNAGYVKKVPTHLNLFVTSKCNAACLHCFVNTNKQQNELSIDEIEKLISLKLGRLVNLNISGGEPFLRDDLTKICQIFYKNNKVGKIHLPSNCLMPSKIYNMLKDILKRYKCRVCFSLSLDGPANIHNEMRQVEGAYDKVFETYGKVVQLKKDYKNLTLNIGTVISNKNHQHIPQLIELVKDNMPDIDSHGFDWIRGNARDSYYTLPEQNDIEGIVPILKKTREYYVAKKKSKIFKLELAARLLVEDVKLKILKQKTQTIPCLAGYIFTVIDEIGNVYLCELLPGIGNIRQDSLNKIWNSPQADKQRRFIREKGCYCVHGCFVPSNVTHNILMYPQLLKNFYLKAKLLKAYHATYMKE